MSSPPRNAYAGSSVPLRRGAIREAIIDRLERSLGKDVAASTRRDIYDALTTARPYKPAFSHQHAVEIMQEEMRRGWRDPELVPLFAEVTQQGLQNTGGSMQESLESMRRHLAK